MYRKYPEHTADNYLKAILESIEYYNSKSRIDISNWLFEGYKKAEKIPGKETSRKAIILELISKWVQEFEDLAILCLMFAGALVEYEGNPIISPTKEPFEIYTHLTNQQILKFFTVAKKGLPKKVTAKIYALETAQELLKNGVISKKEYPYFKSQIDLSIDTAKENLNRMGDVYSSRRKRGRLGYGNFVKTYFQTKHGFKMIHPTETSRRLWDINKEELVLIDRVVTLQTGRKVLNVGRYQDFGDSDVKLLVERIEGWSKVIEEITGAHLRKLENPNFIVPMIRSIKTMEVLDKTRKKPGRNQECLCESGLKFKKCCEPNLP